MKSNIVQMPGGPKPVNDEPPPHDDDFEHDDSHDPTAPPPASGEGPGPAKTTPVRCAGTVLDVLEDWEKAGPLIHEPLGIAELDEWTGGGPVYGTRWFALGAPDAGKTALEVQLGHDLAKRGVTVGLLAADEEAGDLVTRLAQRIGFSRHHCEARDPAVLAQMRDELAELPIRFYDGSWTIENAAADLAAWAKQRAEQDPASHPNGPRAFFGIDSIQTVTCGAEVNARLLGRELSEVSAVTARVHAVRTVATQHRLIALATSEMGRGAYRTSDPSQQTSTMASGKWSGAIEYSGRVVLAVRSVSGEKDLIEVEVAKNKHGPRDVKTYLRIDRRSQTLTAVNYEPEPQAAPAERRASGAKALVVADAVAIVRLLEERPGLGVRQLRIAMRAATGIGSERVDAAIEALGGAVAREPGPNKSQLMSVHRNRLPPGIEAALRGVH